jgi:hypothetical protein
MLDTFAQKNGIPVDTLKTAIILLGNYPLCLAFYYTPKAYKHGFSVIISTLSFTLLFNPMGFAQLLGLSLLCYYLTKFTRHQSWGPILVFVVALLTLSLK